MGCDIHWHAEIKINGKWEHYAHTYVARNYRLFELMAGVRGDEGNAVSPPKGLPNDCSAVTRLLYAKEEGDAHSMSWLSAAEIAGLEERWALLHDHKMFKGRANITEIKNDFEHSVFHCYLFGSSWASFALYPDERPKDVEDVRWVFWFDN